MKAIAVPTLEQAIELVHTGKIHDFNFEINGWNAKLNGFEYVVNGTTYNVPELRKISPDTNREATYCQTICGLYGETKGSSLRESSRKPYK